MIPVLVFIVSPFGKLGVMVYKFTVPTIVGYNWVIDWFCWNIFGVLYFKLLGDISETINVAVVDPPK